MGGGVLRRPEPGLQDFMLGLAGSTASARVLSAGTAGGENPEDGPASTTRSHARECEPSHLTLFGMPDNPAAQLVLVRT